MVKVSTCGCCTNGCCCWNHQDTPNGLPPQKCALHRLPGPYEQSVDGRREDGGGG